MSRLLARKFGGHALANPARVRVAARRIAAWRKRGLRGALQLRIYSDGAPLAAGGTRFRAAA